MIDFRETGSSDVSPRLPAEAGPTLLAIARDALSRHFGREAMPWSDDPWLAAPGATFVTLQRDGALRGCIGTLEAARPLREDVCHNAIAAALHDDRFPPLVAAELDATRIEVSLLSRPEPRPAASEAEAAALLRPGIDGVILSAGARRGTYLPQVWAQLPDPLAFLRALGRKAGLPDGSWTDDTRIATYQVHHWGERRA